MLYLVLVALAVVGGGVAVWLFKKNSPKTSAKIEDAAKTISKVFKK